MTPETAELPRRFWASTFFWGESFSEETFERGGVNSHVIAELITKVVDPEIVKVCSQAHRIFYAAVFSNSIASSLYQ